MNKSYDSNSFFFLITLISMSPASIKVCSLKTIFLRTSLSLCLNRKYLFFCIERLGKICSMGDSIRCQSLYD